MGNGLGVGRLVLLWCVNNKEGFMSLDSTGALTTPLLSAFDIDSEVANVSG